MKNYSPWRCESDSLQWLTRFNSLSEQSSIPVARLLDVARWTLLWDRQICLELVGDAQPESHLSLLQSRLLGTQEPGKTPFWEHRKLVDLSLFRLGEYSPKNTGQLYQATYDCFLELLRAETDACIEDLHKLGRSEFLQATSQLANPEPLFFDPHGHRIDSDTNTKYWGHWYPGLANDQIPLDVLIASLPGASDVDIPEIVRQLENPSSPVALPGAVTLRRHDVIHILLGRGLLDQDEAFVLGFTMGNDSKYRDADGVLMRKALEHWYPEPFRILGNKLQIFNLGVQTGQRMGIPDIAHIPIEELRSQSVGQARQELKISVEQLRQIYAQEKRLNPKSLESGRLPR
jgi:hypothetical protein